MKGTGFGYSALEKTTRALLGLVQNAGSVVGIPGTGLWHSVGGILQGAAFLGAAATFPVVNAASTDLAYVGVSGDSTMAATGVMVNVAINGATVPVAGALTTGNVLQVTGVSALGYAPINLGGGANFVTGVLPTANQAPQTLTLTGDVTGTTAASVLSAISGASPIVVTPNNLQWAAGATGPKLSQAVAAAAGSSFTWQPQFATTGASGSAIINVGPPGTGTTEAALLFQRNSVTVMAFGQFLALTGTALWLDTTAAAQTALNYTLGVNATAVFLNAGTGITFSIAGVAKMTLQPGNLSFVAGAGASTIQQTSQVGNTAATGLTISAQNASLAGVGANQNGAKLTLAGGNSTGAGTGVGGLVSINSGWQARQFTATSNYTADTNANVSDCIIFVNQTGGVTITLPPALGSRMISIKDIAGNAAANHITISPAAGNIDGAASYVLNLNFAGVLLGSDGSNWFVLAGYNGTVI